MSVLGFGYVVNNQARVALKRALGNPRNRVLGVEWESILTFGFATQYLGVGKRKAPAESGDGKQIFSVRSATGKSLLPNSSFSAFTAPRHPYCALMIETVS